MFPGHKCGQSTSKNRARPQVYRFNKAFSSVSVKETNVTVPQKTESKLLGNGYTSSQSKELLNGNLPFVHEGWVKTTHPEKTTWEKKYAKLTGKWLYLYESPSDAIPASSVDICPAQGYARLVPDDGDDTLNIEVHSSSCWPPETVQLQPQNAEDKRQWTEALNAVLLAELPYKGLTLLSLKDAGFDVNCFSGDPKVLGTERGLVSWRNDKEMLFIDGPTKVHQICAIPSDNLVVMIAETDRILIQCDLNVLHSLTLTKQFSNPTLTYDPIAVSDLTGFHLFRCSDFSARQFVCAATATQVVILRYNALDRDFRPLRILDTAEPTGCIFFAEHSLIVGANKFFEIDLSTFQADEFLDVCDDKLSEVVRCYRRNSFPLAIVRVRADPVEFLLCFNEFGVFVDEFGRSCRDDTLHWSRLPLAFEYRAPYLYAVHFNGIEILRIRPQAEAQRLGFDSRESPSGGAVGDSFKLELKATPRFLGAYGKGIVVLVRGDLVLVEGMCLDRDNVSLSSCGTAVTQPEQEQFSFTASMVDSLDGQTSDSEATTDLELKKKVKFTDL